ncbi:MAG: hypothetical protein WC490_08080 [Candidatus Margulisiibacteriota bacterium]
MEIFTPRVAVKARQETPAVQDTHIALKTVGMKKTCIYECSKECIPSSRSRLCIGCPRGFQFSLKHIVGSVYKKIVGLAINMFSRENY